MTWGAWDGSDGDPARVRVDAADENNVALITNRIFFGSVNPTPTSQLPVTGSFTYAGSTDGLPGIAFIGQGRGDIWLGFPASLDDLSVSFDVDFGSGAISNGGCPGRLCGQHAGRMAGFLRRPDPGHPGWR
ncbi:MAG: hypothetical protein U5R48_16435 [Gammaproteobacteria bacterium]|nr:hypothetical protein [Gammaproteobacteria bacterium]